MEWLEIHDAPQYEHEPFIDGSKQIRLCRVDYDPKEGAYLTLKNFYTAQKQPYRALSYTWGASEEFKHVPIRSSNGLAAFRVSTNLFNFFEVYKHHNRTGYVWIDQVCIDQSQGEEKNAQVPLMGQIYRNAHEVIVWLGVKPDPSAFLSALDIFHHTKLSTFGQRPFKSQEDLAWRQRFREHDHEFQALCTFVENRYWTRLWIVQELLLARFVMVYYGDLVFPWQHIMESRTCIYQLEDLRLREQAEFVVRLMKPNLRDPCEVIRAFSVHKCQDYHDGVYGLLALFEEGGMRWPYVVNYNLSPKDLFIDMAIVLFSTEQDLSPLALASLSTILPVKVIGDLAGERAAKQRGINDDRRARGEVEIVFSSDGHTRGQQDMHKYFVSLMGDFYGRPFDQEAEFRLRDMLERHLA